MFKPLAAALSLSLVQIVAGAAPAAASDLAVAVEHAQVIRLPGEASAIVVGNPSIADAMVHDGRTLVVTGRLQGRTNVIALDRVGRIIYSREIVVSNPAEGHVALFRGPQRNTLSCGAVCDPVPRVGDATETESTLSGQQGSRLSTANSAMGRASGGPE